MPPTGRSTTGSYVLTLPSCPLQGVSRNKLIQQIVSHIENGGGDLTLDLDNRGNLADCGPGADFSYTMMAPLDGPGGHLSTDIAAAEHSMFSEAFERKHPKLTNLKDYDRIALLLINEYWHYNWFPDHKRAAGVARRLISQFPGIDDVYLQIGDDLRRIV